MIHEESSTTKKQIDKWAGWNQDAQTIPAPPSRCSGIRRLRGTSLGAAEVVVENVIAWLVNYKYVWILSTQ